MNEITTAVFFDLIGSAIKDAPVNENIRASITDESIKKMIVMAKKHDVSVLLSHALEKNGLFPRDEELKKHLQKELMLAIYRYEHLNYELQAVCDVLEKNKIEHIPLKGSVIRKYYPQPWLRTSCDIDILVRREALDDAIDCIINELGYRNEKQGMHDVSMFSNSGVHLELHFGLNEPLYDPYRILDEVWDYTRVKSESEYTYEMTDEVFFFYHIAHMSKHFLSGGCGIRPFIDLWFLNHVVEGNNEKRTEILKSENLFKFYVSVSALSEIWFSNKEHDDISQKMQNYVIFGGVYGNSQNRIHLQQSKKGGKIKFAMERIFLPYEYLKYRYPILNKHKWLTPIMEIRRWFSLLFCGGLKRSVNELQLNNSVSQTEAEEIKLFLDRIGL